MCERASFDRKERNLATLPFDLKFPIKLYIIFLALAASPFTINSLHRAKEWREREILKEKLSKEMGSDSRGMCDDDDDGLKSPSKSQRNVCASAMKLH